MSGQARVPDGTPPSTRRRWAGLLFISLGVAMIIVDATILNVAIPQIIADLHITATDAQWIQDAYTLVFAALLLAAGRIADRSGRRRLFLAGVVVFVAASVAAALAGGGPSLIAARLIQGVGGAAILPASLSLLNATFRDRERAIAFAVWGSTIGGTAALGPLLGGWLTTTLSWRWAFGINLGIGALVFTGVARLVDESRSGTGERGADWLGAALSVVGLGGIVFALIEGRSDGWWWRTGTVRLAGLTWQPGLSPVPVAAAVGITAIALFLWWESYRGRRGRPVLLDLSLFGIASFRNGNIAAAIVSLGEFGILFAVPLWLQNARGLTAFDTGLVLLALATGSFAASGIAPVLVRRRGPLLTVRVGIGLELIGVASLGTVITAHTTPAVLLGPLLVYGAGVGMATAQLTGVVLADVPIAQSGQGAATQSTARQIGSALGIAILGTILFTTLAANLTDQLAKNQQTPAQARSGIVRAVTSSAGAAIPALAAEPGGAPVAAAAREALSEATRTAAFCAAGFLTLGLAATTRLRRSSTATPREPAPARVHRVAVPEDRATLAAATERRTGADESAGPAG